MSKYNLIDIYEQYKIGSGWTKDFDYEGMLKTGLATSIDTPIEVLKKMAEDYTDVNYHREAHHLYKAIEALEDGATKEASMFFGDFHAEIENTMKEVGMDIEPTVGQFMASKMEEGEEVEEVTSREGSRIEGLLDQNMKAQFLDAFEDLYFNLVEEDPFHAEDVVDHLAIEMLKHLDAIQAQGDKLNSAGNPSVEFTPGERIGEEEEIEEGGGGAAMFGPFEFLKSKGIDDDVIADFMKVHAKDIVGASEDEIMDEFENFRSVNYDYVDENLKEHFGRFMKDYQ